MDYSSKDVSKRFKTMPLGQIDTEQVARKVDDEWKRANTWRDDYLRRREEYTRSWRELRGQPKQGPWENSSNMHIPLQLIDGKAIHARLWQLFSDFQSLFGVRARKEAFEDKEESVREFLQFIISSWCNGKTGTKDTFDEFLWDLVFEGSGLLKVYWQRDTHKYADVEPQVEITETTSFDPRSATGNTSLDVTETEEEVIKEEIVETPQIRRMLIEDVVMPQGQTDPQEAEHVTHRIFLTSDGLKRRGLEGKFDMDVVSECLEHCEQTLGANEEDEIKRERKSIDGFEEDTSRGYYQGYHVVLERYGKIFVKKKIENEEDLEKDISETAEEVVVWVHQATRKVLGWTYLYRISPSGIRPIFKADYIHFPDRNVGVGVPEAMQSLSQALDAVYNLRQDSGTLASMPFGFYRPSSGLKADKFKVEPGTFFPTDDPAQDYRVVQMPYLSGFGNQEEDRLVGYTERLFNISDLTLGRSPQKVGLFRTASGANAAEGASGIQLEIHFDRLARTLSKMFQCLFVLCRERMPEELYYRITGDNGEPVFGKVNRDDLKGDFDFDINVDVLGEERQMQLQKSTMMMQMMINPAFMQSGVVTPSNLYSLARNFLMKNRVRRIDNYISKPQDYQGDIVTPAERVFRIVVSKLTDPTPADTVRLQENHEEAMKYYESFEQSDNFGLLQYPAQLQAFQDLKARHMQSLQAQTAGANPNMTGMQVPREGFAPMQAGATDQGTLGSPMGEVNGPVV